MVAPLAHRHPAGRRLTHPDRILGHVPLPSDPKAPWPPTGQKPIQDDFATADAWWAGDPARLTALYTGSTSPAGSRWNSFWSRKNTTPTQQPTDLDRVHVPIASDIASAAADLLFGEPLKITVPGAGGDTPDAGAAKTQDRLDQLVDLVGLGSTLLEAAEVASGLGGVYLRPTWDPEIAPHPLLHVIHADRAVPEWRWGRLVAVTFWTVVSTEGDVVWRHLERHEPGQILTGLYCGDRDMLGVSQPLDAHPATARLEAEQDLTVMLGAPVMLARYVPNVRPNRRHRNQPVGRSDCAGLEPLMDALDEAMTSWMRDIDLGKRRIIVPSEFLETNGRGKGAVFNTDTRVFTPLEMDPAHQERAGIEMIDFDIRAGDHAATVATLAQQIVRSAGYSPQTLGFEGSGGLRTATEVSADEGKSAATTCRKQGYWTPPLVDVLELLLLIDARLFNSGVEPARPQVAFPDPNESSIREVGTTLNLISLAKAASTKTKVKMLHPEWSPQDVDDEVAAIRLEEGVVGDPTGGFPL